MNISTVWAAYFSATDTTRKVVSKIAARIAQDAHVPMQTFDFTLPTARKAVKAFQAGDLVVFGTPVYAGRVPNLLLKYVASVQGNGAMGVPVVCYGHRNYDDALIELRNTMEGNGFRTVAGAAFLGEHSFSTTMAAGRPDTSDLTIASGFADQVFHKVTALHSFDAHQPVFVAGYDPIRPYFTPRDRYGNGIDIRKVRPKTSDACNKCGKCARLCPLGSIDREDVTKLIGPCMKCNSCVKNCPKGAKYFDDPNYLYHKSELEALYSWPRQEPALFL